MDPPYNTEATKNDGNSVANDKENINSNKFIYRDKYSRNGWLNFMNERLRLAKKLLKDDGVIFVSIDDSEQAYLKVLMDEIFGEENFVASMPRKTTSHIRLNSASELQKLHDYILVYFNLKASSSFKKVNKGKITFNNKDENGEFLLKPFQNSGANGLRERRPNLFYPIYINKNNSEFSIDEKNKNNDDWIEVFPKKVKNNDGCWLWKKETFESKKDKIVYKNGTFFRKIYKEELTTLFKLDHYKTWLDTFENRYGSKLIADLGFSGMFDYPKPVEVIKFCINLKDNDDARILDFFSGSGTTAQAVLDLNREDYGNRTFTLVTNNENNIGIDVNYERLYRINHGFGTNNESFEWSKKNEPYKANLNVYSMDYIDISPFSNVDTKEIIKELIKVLNDFGVNNLNQENDFDIKELLNSLLSLKPQVKEQSE
ncbi:DNA methyltransferase [Mesomycoplasma molare]|uniref:DNA methyltransferase n=1 Tax=Mesomycoplasma molare TaxID=171288 RepID=A0ABY5TV88_9BACT|nr:DNA methyltransferase [Mesomycoplasma molare]UWD34588.1 DNA methyltransferase [Mesomycoplasma molare]